jgi:hypothetical protein
MAAGRRLVHESDSPICANDLKVGRLGGAREGAPKSLGLAGFCHPIAGGWYDQFDREGKSLSSTSTATASAFVTRFAPARKQSKLLR